jgi:hypothetical protein
MSFEAHMFRRVLPAAILLTFGAAPLRAQSVPTPNEFLHLTVGADRTLADWKQITAYFARLAASPAVHVDTLGATTNRLLRMSPEWLSTA